ncbi:MULTISPECIES: uracil phosphoribosyltransferase [Salinibaculum]|uniref:uracil phosphoribosyltransferase n=1 Tax=Salinibaculum TaxID=2732368 RepID=UPI0030CFCC4B
MGLEEREHAVVVTHPLAQQTLTDLRRADTDSVAFREGLVDLGRLCGYELVDGYMETEAVPIRTPLTETTGQRVAGLEDVVVVNVLRAATPFVEGLLKTVPDARQGVISASRDEEAGMDDDGEFPIEVQYVKLPDIRPEDTVVVADPMLATGSTMCTVLEEVTGGQPDPEQLVVLSAVSAPPGLERVGEAFPNAERITVGLDDRLDDDGFIVPGLGDAGDRAFNTN